MKTQAILVAAIALLLGTEAGFLKPEYEPDNVLPRTAPKTRNVLPDLGNYFLFMPMHLTTQVAFQAM
jgi:hypothetical protein